MAAFDGQMNYVELDDGVRIHSSKLIPGQFSRAILINEFGFEEYGPRLKLASISPPGALNFE